MIGIPGKNLSNTRGADAEPPLNHLWDEIEALPDSDARFGAILENAAVGIACVAPDRRWVEVNQRLCDIVGYTREELLTKTFGDITHPDDLEQDLGAMRRMLAGEIETCLREKRYYHKDGSVVWANLAASLMRKADGSPDYFISIVEDISERKRAEEKLREREERLLLVSWISGLGIFEWDVQADRAVWENERMYEIFGHTRADGALSRAQFVEKYMRPDDVATFGQEFVDKMKTGRPFHIGFLIRRKDGALRWLGLAAATSSRRPRANHRGLESDCGNRRAFRYRATRSPQGRRVPLVQGASRDAERFGRQGRQVVRFQYGH